MARNLRARISVDDSLLVFDLNRETTKRFSREAHSSHLLESAARERSRRRLLREGALVRVADTAQDLVKGAETIITMLPEPRHVKALFEELANEETGVNCANAEPRKLFIDCSTIDVTTSLDVAQLAKFSGLDADFVDAPVSGGVVGATKGTLTFMVGAEEHLLERVALTLCYMGSKVLHCGNPGSGLATKLTNNYLLAISNIATAEAMNLGIQMGLDPHMLKDAINVSSGRCWSSEVNNPIDNAEKGFAGGFGVSLMLKDLKLAMSAAEKCKARLDMAKIAKDIYEGASDREDCRGRDFSVVYRYLGGKEPGQE